MLQRRIYARAKKALLAGRIDEGRKLFRLAGEAGAIVWGEVRHVTD